MITLKEVFAIIVIHWIADFILQDEKWAINKSKSNKALLSHTVTYLLAWVVFGMLWGIVNNTLFPNWLLWFVTITFVCHTITDYFTSRIVSKKFKANKYGSPIPNFGAFTIIGFDQVLHYVQLFLTYYYLKP